MANELEDSNKIDAFETPWTAPPSYDNTLSPALNLTFLTNVTPPLQPAVYQLVGDSRDPDLLLIHSSQPSMPIATLSTDSTLVFHHTHVIDHRPGGVMHILKRHSNLPNGEYRYIITTHGSNGTKILEITTSPTILTAASTRLIFRHPANGQLDAIRLKSFLPGSAKGKLGKLNMTVEYQGSCIGRISLTAKPEKPVYELSIDVAGVDPILFAILATVVDDRLMTSKRRLRRGVFRGLAGVGKGPGAGLAGAYALGGAI